MDDTQVETQQIAKELSLFGYFVKCWKNLTNFDGRARRKEFWGFWLFDSLIMIAYLFVWANIEPLSLDGINTLLTLYGLITALPRLSVSCRRMHDTNRSGWFILLNIIPFIGWIIFLAICVENSQAEANKYGPNPKALNENTTTKKLPENTEVLVLKEEPRKPEGFL
jgi:uncharacterized membrane protein YhaH (DUF805 family)